MKSPAPFRDIWTYKSLAEALLKTQRPLDQYQRGRPHLAQIATVGYALGMGRARMVVLVAIVVVGCADEDRRGVAVVDSGRYWAELSGQGRLEGATTVWFELDGGVAVRTPEQPLAAGAELATARAWLVGLAPGTTYDVRLCAADGCSPATRLTTRAAPLLPWIEIDATSPKHLRREGGERFHVWGTNYVKVTGAPNDLLEDAMGDPAGLARIEADLGRLENLAPPNGATNAIRIHLQLHEFLLDAATPDPQALAQLAQVVELAEDHGLYVMVTGLNYFYPAENPRWIAEQGEAARWATQALWWSRVAHALQHSSGVFAYDLMNEPYVASGHSEGGITWWTTVAPDAFCDYGADPANGVNGMCFGQYISPGVGDRTSVEVSAAWVQGLVRAIREHDRRHLVTLGMGAFGLANPLNGAPEVHQHLDFLSPHLYPEPEDADAAIAFAAALDGLTDKPIIAGETFPFGPVDVLIRTACQGGTVQGWFGQYDGRRLGDPCPDPGPFGCVLHDAWYQLVRDFGPALRSGRCPP